MIDTTCVRNCINVRNLNACISSGNNRATSRKNLVNFGPVTPEITGRICIPICTCIRQKSACTPSFRNALAYWNADWRINSGDDHAIHDINLVGF